MTRLLLAVLLAAGPAFAQDPSTDSLLQGGGFDGAVARDAGGDPIQRTIDESPTLTNMIRDAEKNRTWRDYYDERIVGAAVASWGSNIKAGYLKGTAVAYATYKTAPPVVNVVAGAALWAVGVVYGFCLTVIAVAVTGHL